MTEQLDALRSSAVASRYSDEAMKQLDTLEQMFVTEGNRGFERYKDCITHALTVELMGRRAGERGRIEALLSGDPQLEAGISLLRDRKALHQQDRRAVTRFTGGSNGQD